MDKSIESNEKETKAILNKCKNRQAQSKRQLQREKHRKGTCKSRQAKIQLQKETNAKRDNCKWTKAEGYKCNNGQMWK